MRMPDVPAESWKRKTILRMALKAGKPLTVAEYIEKTCRGHFGRVCVEIDLSKPLVVGTTVVLKGSEYRQPFIYENSDILFQLQSRWSQKT